MIIELEYATGALGDNDISTAGDHGTGAGFTEFVGYFRILEAGDTPTAATGTGIGQIHQFYPRQGGKLFAYGTAYLRIEAEVTGIMHCHDQRISLGHGAVLAHSKSGRRQGRLSVFYAHSFVMPEQEEGGINDALRKRRGMSILTGQRTVAGGAEREYGHIATLGESFKVLLLSPVERFTKTGKLGGGPTAGLSARNEYHIAAGSEPFYEPERSIYIDEPAKTACEQSYFAHLCYMVGRSDPLGKKVVE